MSLPFLYCSQENSSKMTKMTWFCWLPYDSTYRGLQKHNVFLLTCLRKTAVDASKTYYQTLYFSRVYTSSGREGGR